MTAALIRLLRQNEAEAAIPALADVLIDAVADGGSISFPAKLGRDQAIAYWTGIGAEVIDGRIFLLVAECPDGICGMVQLVLSQKPDQPHRADVAQLHVRRGDRRQGIASSLLTSLEQAGRAAGRSLLLSTTVAESPAEKLIMKLGWVEAGFIPRYALDPGSKPYDAAFYYKEI